MASRIVARCAVFATVVDAQDPFLARSKPQLDQCVIEQGIDYFGGDYKNLPANSVEQCCSACNDEGDNCAIATYWENVCYLKSVVNKAVASSDRVSVRLSSTPTPTPGPTSPSLDQCVIEQGIDYFGGDYKNLPASSVEQCCSACIDEGDHCAIATYWENICYLKSVVNKAVASSDRVSVRPSSTPTPTPGPPPPSPTSSPTLTPTSTPTSTPAQCTVRQGTDFIGGDFYSKPADSADACCAACAREDACLAGVLFDGVCYLKNSIANPISSTGRIAVIVGSVPPPAPRYDLCSGTYNVGGYTCQTLGESDTKVFFPCNQESPRSFPAVIYAHGLGSQGEIDALKEGPIRAVVSTGIIVIAPYTTSTLCSSSTEYKDLLRALQISESNPSLHKALPRINWDRIGVWGNSMGGKTTPLAVAKSHDTRIRAMVCAYGARHSGTVGNIPSMYITGTADVSSSPASKMYQEFASNPADRKIFLNLYQVGHMGNLMDAWLAKFLACHLRASDQEQCDAIYGSDRAICQSTQFAENGCIVEGGARRLTVYV